MITKKMMFTALSASLLLAACGTGTSDAKQDTPKVESSETANQGGNTNSETENNNATSGESATVGTETKSDAQNFKMQVLPEYELTSEEPGRDVLFVKEDSERYMSISMKKATESSYDKELASLTEQLAATSSDASPVELTEKSKLPADKALAKLKAYQVASTEGPITAIIYERNNMIFKLMIYDNNKEEYTKDFLTMAETIQPIE